MAQLRTKDLSQWNAADVSAWLSSIDGGVYQKYSCHFEREKIDGLALQYLSESDLHALGVSIMGDRKHIIHSLNELFKQFSIDIAVNSLRDEPQLPVTPPWISDDADGNASSSAMVDINLDDNDNQNERVAKEQQHDAADDAHIARTQLQRWHADADHIPPVIELPQIDNALSNISHHVLRIEYDVPWSIEPQHRDINACISELFLSAPSTSSQTSGSHLCTFRHDIDRDHNQLILYGNFIELSSFIKDLYQLQRCLTLDIPVRIAQFLWRTKELTRIARTFHVIPFIRGDDKLAIYRSNSVHLNGEQAVRAVRSLLQTLDCSQFYGPLNTLIIGTLLTQKSRHAEITAQLAPFGTAEFVYHGQRLFDAARLRRLPQLRQHDVGHLLLIKASSPSHVSRMHVMIHAWRTRHSSHRTCEDAALVWFLSDTHGVIQELQRTHDVFIGGCVHTQQIFVCGATSEIREQVLDTVCNHSIYSQLSHHKLSATLQQYLVHCASITHIRTLRYLYSKEWTARFVAVAHGDGKANDNAKATEETQQQHAQISLVTPEHTAAVCDKFITRLLEPSVLQHRARMQRVEYMTLLSKIWSKKLRTPPHCVMDEDGAYLYVFHTRLRNAQQRQFVTDTFARFEEMPMSTLDVRHCYPWFKQHLPRTFLHLSQFKSDTYLLSLLDDDGDHNDDGGCIHIRCPARMHKVLQQRMQNTLNRVFAIPMFERMVWLIYYQRNNNLSELDLLSAPGFLTRHENANGMFYLYHKDYRESFAWIDKYLEIVLQIGLTYNQFPEDEHILQRDTEFVLHILPKFNLMRLNDDDGTGNGNALFAYPHVVNFILLMVYQCVLSTRYDLCKALWHSIHQIRHTGANHNILIPNFLHVVFCKSGTEFSQKDMKQFLVDTQILFQPEMMQFILKTLKENQQHAEMTLLRNVLEDIHLDNNIEWSFKDVNWSI